MMKKIQKLCGLIFVFLFALSLFACTSKTSNNTIPNESNDAPNENASNDKVLVVYFSATGNTKRVAEYIAKTTNAKLFEIVPSIPYSSSDLRWTDSTSRVSREHEDQVLRDVPLVTAKVENWDEFDTVFIGYPIWWGIAAWPINNFVKNNDFSNKTVIPFATSSSSGLGQSGALLEEMAGTGTWQTGQRFSSSVSQNSVLEWVNSLGLNER